MATFEKYMGLDSLASFGCIRSMHARSYIVTSTAMTAHMIHLFRLTTTACGLEIHDHTRKIIYKSKISTNGWTYAGQYLCDGWVHNLEVTPLLLILLPVLCFLIQGDNLKKTINCSRHKNVLKRRIIYLRCE